MHIPCIIDKLALQSMSAGQFVLETFDEQKKIIHFTELSKLDNNSFSNSKSESAPTILWQFLNNLVLF